MLASSASIRLANARYDAKRPLQMWCLTASGVVAPGTQSAMNESTVTVAGPAMVAPDTLWQIRAFAPKDGREAHRPISNEKALEPRSDTTRATRQRRRSDHRQEIMRQEWLCQNRIE